jgi:hypothetical protein
MSPILLDFKLVLFISLMVMFTPIWSDPNMKNSVLELAATRKSILSLFETDCTTDDEANMVKLSDVERRIELAEFDTDADMLAGQRMLLDSNDTPATFDDFKIALFFRMQERTAYF